MSNSFEKTRRILEYINRLMAENPGMSYDDAWAKAKREKFKQPELLGDGNPQERIRGVQGWIRRLMQQAPGLTYDEAWERAKQSKDLAGIFLAMEPKPHFDNPAASPFQLSRRAESDSREIRKREMVSPGDLPSPEITNHPVYR